MKITIGNTLVPNCAAAVTVKIEDDNGVELAMFNCRADHERIPAGAQCTLTRVDGVGKEIEDAQGVVQAVAKSASEGMAAQAAAELLAARVVPPAADGAAAAAPAPAPAPASA